MMDIIGQYYDRCLGSALDKITVRLPDQTEQRMAIHVYANQPCAGAVALITVGLSLFPLHRFKEELTFLCYEHYYTEELVQLFSWVASDVALSRHPLRQGQLLPPAGPLLSSTKMEALYTTAPVYLPLELWPIRLDQEEIPVLWLIPVHRSEAKWISTHGQDDFETLLVERNPDLLDLARGPVV